MKQNLSGDGPKFNGMETLLYSIYASLDLHVGHCVLGWMDPQGRMLGKRRFVTSAENLRREVAALGKAGVILTLEACPMMRWAAALLRPLVDRLVVCDPRRNKLVCADPAKNDWKDVESLCRLLRLGELREVWVGQEPRRDLLRAAVMEYLKWRNQQRTLKTLIKTRYHQMGIHRLDGKAVFGREGRAGFLGQIADPEHRILLERLYRQFDQAWELWLETGRQVRRLGRAFPEIGQFQKMPGIARGRRPRLRRHRRGPAPIRHQREALALLPAGHNRPHQRRKTPGLPAHRQGRPRRAQERQLHRLAHRLQEHQRRQRGQALLPGQPGPHRLGPPRPPQHPAQDRRGHVGGLAQGPGL
jgi:hypothetical protein